MKSFTAYRESASLVAAAGVAPSTAQAGEIQPRGLVIFRAATEAGRGSGPPVSLGEGDGAGARSELCFIDRGVRPVIDGRHRGPRHQLRFVRGTAAPPLRPNLARSDREVAPDGTGGPHHNYTVIYLSQQPRSGRGVHPCLACPPASIPHSLTQFTLRTPDGTKGEIMSKEEGLAYQHIYSGNRNPDNHDARLRFKANWWCGDKGRFQQASDFPDIGLRY